MPFRNPKSSNLRKHRLSTTGGVYLVTFCCLNRQPIFVNTYLGNIVANEIRISDKEGRSLTYAFVVMPDHVHWLFQLMPHFSLSSAVRRLKGRAAYLVNKKRRTAGSIWQPGFHDRALRNDEYLDDAGNYVIANPVRAGLVESVTDYPLQGLMMNNIQVSDRGYSRPTSIVGAALAAICTRQVFYWRLPVNAAVTPSPM